MKTMKILVVDDTNANIEAAKIASGEFPKHEFVFMTSANEAFKEIQNFDAVISDLFFLEKPGEEMVEIYEKMQSVYSEDSNIYKRQKEGRSHLFPTERLQKNIEIVKDGLHKSLTSRDELREPEFPLGLPVLIFAKKNQKKLCLVSDLHVHGEADGDIILLPLMSDIGGYIFKTGCGDGNGTLNYFGSNRMSDCLRNETNGPRGKLNPIIWEKAIYCILAQ